MVCVTSDFPAVDFGMKSHHSWVEFMPKSSGIEKCPANTPFCAEILETQTGGNAAGKVVPR